MSTRYCTYKVTSVHFCRLSYSQILSAPGKVMVKSLSFFVLFFLFAHSISYSQANASGIWTLTANGTGSPSGNVSVSDIVGGSGINSISYGGSGAYATGWTSAGSKDNSDYFEVSVSPMAGYNLTIDSIAFFHLISKASGNGNHGGPTQGAVYYSLASSFTSETQIQGDFTQTDSEAFFDQGGLSIDVLEGETLTIRIYGWSAENANGTFYLRNLGLFGSTYSTTAPILNSSTTALNFGYVDVNGVSEEQSFTVSGEYLTGTAIVLAAPSDFEISTSSGGGYGSSLNLIYSGSTLTTTTIYCRFKPTLASTDYNNNIVISGGGTASNLNVAVSGTTVVSCLKNAFAVHSSTGVTNVSGIIGSPDNAGALLDEIGDRLALDVTGGSSLVAGDVIDVYWACTSNNKSSSIMVELSENAIT